MAKLSGCRVFDEDFLQLASLCGEDITSAEQLGGQLEKIYTLAFNVDFARYELKKLKQAAPHLLDDFYDLRLALRSQIGTWKNKNYLTPRNEELVRNVFRALRVATDLIGELMIGFRRRAPGHSLRRAFAKGTGGTLFHPKLRQSTVANFASGDVVIVRGTIHNSAAIARISDVDSQFSHAGLVYIDPDGGQHMVEALIECGATTNNLHQALSHDLGRAVVYRHPNREVAERAAADIYAHVQKSKALFAKRIPYDFSMELAGYDKLFCSKLIRQAYDEASDGGHKLPTFPSRFERGARDFLDRIGVTAMRSFAPADMELEPSFEAIAEWRDFERTSSIRLQDFIMVKLFEWMEQKGYTFREPPALKIVSRIGLMSAYAPWPLSSLISMVVPRVPTNMKRDTISAIAMLHYTAEPLFERLQYEERRSIRRRGYPLHPREIMEHLETIREAHPERVGYLFAPEENHDAASPQTSPN